MKILIIGGTGHSGSWLCRMLVEEGHAVVVASSGRTTSHLGELPKGYRQVALKYAEAVRDSSLLKLLQTEKVEVIVDFLQGATPAIYELCRQAGVGQLVVCGSVWMLGRPKVVPVPEIPQADCPFESYRKRFADLNHVLHQARRDGLPFTAILPPNICGPGKVPLDGKGGRSVETHREHRRGVPVTLPFPGTNLIGPCDAEDVAQGFFLAITKREAAAGEMFNVGSAYALTIEKFIQAYAQIHGVRIPIEYVDARRFVEEVMPDPGANFHFMEHMCPDLTKVSARLGYRSRYTPEETMERAVRWMIDRKLL